ncbi:hypothetical protein XELAEV_18043891mg [Xenopus laevis]|uniref:Uncharacterized protein n=1 Tax=Xenopus laevis TaxID=8355 RepID=A0A974BXQ6_XENLA|nr:hypothetical protein XELAEV_18043891mg [Xenopus laevis]
MFRKTVREAVADVIEGTIQLAEVILSSRIQSLLQAQLRSTGSVWESCDQWEKLPKAVVKDAIEEVEQAQTDGEDPFSDIPEDDEIGVRGNQDTYWLEADHRLMAPCLGLMKASKACLKKVLGAIKAHGKQKQQNIVDELAMSMYPPMNHATVHLNAAKLSSVLKNVLTITRPSHLCPETELAWIQFRDSAVDHNMEETKNLTQGALWIV